MQLLSCHGEHHFDKHFHDGYVLWLNSSSAECYSVKGVSDTLQPGCISLIEPGVVHANSPGSGRDRHLRSFYFTEEFVGDLAKAFTGEDHITWTPRTSVFRNSSLWQRLIDLHQSLLYEKNILEAEDKTLSVFLELFEILAEPCRDKTTLAGAEGRLERVIEYLHAHLAKNISLKELAHVAECSSYHLIRLFSEMLGMSPYAYLVQLRLDRARHLLDKNLSIVDTALLTGFSDQSHLTRRFKWRYGLTPGAYKKQKNL